jgi:hypothetical protein
VAKVIIEPGAGTIMWCACIQASNTSRLWDSSFFPHTPTLLPTYSLPAREATGMKRALVGSVAEGVLNDLRTPALLAR